MTSSAPYKYLSRAEIDRVIQMAWEDRTPFDAIKEQFQLVPGDVIKLMRSELKSSSFKLWRARTAGRKTKHISKRGFGMLRFRCPNQKD
ncbi:MAG: TIGR03643 family protein [Planctomycetaceae bacterium]|nr:TIGR03643 family protein [Planctomycetaceae bacterium]